MTRQTDNQIIALWSNLADELSRVARVLSPSGSHLHLEKMCHSATDNAHVELGIALTAASSTKRASLNRLVFKIPN